MPCPQKLLMSSSHRSLFSTCNKIAVSRIVNNSKAKARGGPPRFKPASPAAMTDAYGICIKAKAIAKSSGASQALSFSLNQLDKPANGALKSSSRPVLFNTVLAALGSEGQAGKFWEVVEARAVGNDELWSPQLAATLLNQIAKEMQQQQQQEDQRKELMQKATQIYIKALEILRVPEHLHLHNAYLKCLSRNQDVPFLLWILNLLTKNRFKDIDLGVMGVKEYLPVSDSSLKLVSLLGGFRKPVDLDVQSLTSILGTLSRSPDGSIQLAEGIWAHFQNQKMPLDQACHLALLLVYRNDLSRIFKHRKLIRALSWRHRKLSRVMEIIGGAGVDLAADPKFLSIYFEICMNARLTEKVDEFLQKNPLRSDVKDERLMEVISRSKRGN